MTKRSVGGKDHVREPVMKVRRSRNVNVQESKWEACEGRRDAEMDLSIQEGVYMSSNSRRNGGPKLGRVLKVRCRILETMMEADWKPMDRGQRWCGSWNEAGSWILGQLRRIEGFLRYTIWRSITIIETGCDRNINKCGSAVGDDCWTKEVDITKMQVRRLGHIIDVCVQRRRGCYRRWYPESWPNGKDGQYSYQWIMEKLRFGT